MTLRAELTFSTFHSRYEALDEMMEAPNDSWIHEVRLPTLCTLHRTSRLTLYLSLFNFSASRRSGQWREGQPCIRSSLGTVVARDICLHRPFSRRLVPGRWTEGWQSSHEGEMSMSGCVRES